VDIIGRPHTEDDGPKENGGGEHRPELKAHRRRYAAKGVQSWVVARLAFLIRQARATPANSSPASLRGFSLMLAYFGRRYVNQGIQQYPDGDNERYDDAAEPR
jgi:hypothetical protein